MRGQDTQAPYGVRLGWGRAGASCLGPSVAALVVVDVLSFTTSVSVVTGRGGAVVPCAWGDTRADALAAELGGVVARGRSAATADHPWSLSPAALLAAPVPPVLVLPSPNGSAISARADGPVLAGSLRSARATARWLADAGLGTPDHPVGLIAAGEQWPDGSLRPAVEDLLGAGAIAASLVRGCGMSASPEARVAVAAFEGCADVAAELRDCVSGRELAARGFGADVEVAAAVDADAHAAVLRDGAFRGA